MAEESSDETLSRQRDSVSTFQSLIEYGLKLEASKVISGILSATKIDIDIFQPLKHLIDQEFDINLPYKNRSLFMVAAQFGDQACVRLLLDNGANIDWRDVEGDSALFKAADSKNFENANLLLDKGAETSGQGRDGNSFLHYCLDSPETLRRSLSLLPNPNIQDNDGWAPIHHAVESSNLEAIKILAEYNADLNIQIGEGNMFTPLILAVKEGYMDVVRYLLDAGADTNHRDSESATALHYARTPTAIGLLLQEGAEVDIKDVKGRTALHRLVSHLGDFPKSNIAPIKKMVESGADVNTTDFDDKTPLMTSVEGNCQHIAAYLLSKGADPNTSDLSSRSALDWACFYGFGNMARLLYAAGARVNFNISDSHASSLQTATASENEDSQVLEVVRFLVEDVKVDVNQVAGPHGTVVHLACSRNTSIVLRYFINEGKCNAMLGVYDESGRLPIHIAATRSLDCFQHLLYLGYDLHAVDRTGRNILHYAAMGGSVDAVSQILARSGIEVDAVDNDGWTALCWAVRVPNPWLQVSIVRRLLRAGANKSVSVKGDGCETWTPLEIAHRHHAQYGALKLLGEDPFIDKEQELLETFQKRKYRRTTINCNSCDSIS